ncbi:hypothetical protein [Kocuria rosea]|nr:hypothetical protein [Kocuria rosea]TQN36328.1 hypothetical protein FHX38_2189 [Kocuria rosea]STX01947.1 Uncharacterised protein [Kocuria rosea]STX05485.1 Uncharacterised protein [Kocuria rosea]VEH43037.1 Uncharacterised protein [Kocuria rosea]VEI49860.1 Uncharacterised protein [Kocuria rosea]
MSTTNIWSSVQATAAAVARTPGSTGTSLVLMTDESAHFHRS